MASVLRPNVSHAQDRLVGLRALGIGASLETLHFGGSGLLQGAYAGQDSLRVRSVRQLSIPLTLAMPLGSALTVDITSVYATGTVTYDMADPRLSRGRTVTLAGLSDVRVRATGRISGDALVVTAGVNAPSGKVHLNGEQVTAVRVLAAPALGLGNPPVGAGGSATLGMLSAHGVGRWAIAGGASYELHSSYAPIGVLVAGAPTTDYRPGNVIRLSLGADGFVGRQRLSLSVTADAFGTDRLRQTNAPSTVDAALASVRLGPVLTADAQLQLAVPRVREATLWVSNRWRSSFARDGITVGGSSGNYLDGGFRTTVPLTRRTDLTLAADGRLQSGLSFDEGILTAATTAGVLTAAVSQRVAGLTLQPYARAQVGGITAKPGERTTMTGAVLGLTVLARF